MMHTLPIRAGSRLNLWLAAAAALAIVTAHGSARAQPLDDAPLCEPACAAGELCGPAGQCVSRCNPVCEANEVCTPTGSCVSRCNPTCGTDEICTAAGECVSRCNPACDEGQSCTAAGACVGGESRPVDATPVDAGWARKAGTLGVATTIVLAIMTTVIVVADEQAVALGVGIPATVIGGILIPVVARGGESARKNPGVVGEPGLRRTGWIAYSGALVDAIGLIGLVAAGVDVPPAAGATVGALGVASALCFVVDAYRSANQARDLAAGGRPSTALAPALLIGRDRDQTLVAMPGLTVRF